MKLAWIAIFASTLFGGAALAAPECPLFAPLLRSDAISPYDSAKGYAESTRPFRQFVEYVSKHSDADTLDIPCVRQNLLRWSDSKALLQHPISFEGMRQRIRWVTSFNISARKINVSKSTDHDAVEWLRILSHAVSSDFLARKAERGSADNLYVWSGVTAASFLLIDEDVELRQYANKVWIDALAAIRSDGSIYWETQRGRLSTPYHVYYLGAVLWLRQFLQVPISSYDDEVIDRLKSHIASKICNGDIFGPSNKVSAEYVRPLDDVYWSRLNACGIEQTGYFSPFFGGNMMATKKLLPMR